MNEIIRKSLVRITCVAFVLCWGLAEIALQIPGAISQIRLNYSYLLSHFFQRILTLQDGYKETVWGLFCFIGVILSAHFLGRIVMKKCSSYFQNKNIDFWNHSVVHWGVGIFLISQLWYLLGRVGFLNFWVALALVGCGYATFFYQVSRINYRYTVAIGKGSNFFSQVENWVLFILFFWCLSWGLTSIVPETFFDSLMQHLGLPWMYVMSKKVWASSGNIYTYYSQNMEMLFTWALLLKSEIAAKLISWSFWVATVFFIYVWVKSLSSKIVAAFAAGCYAFVPATYWQTTIAKPDSALAFYLLLAYCAAWQILTASKEQDTSRFLFVLAGFFLGIAVGFKYVALLLALHLILVFLIFNYRAVPWVVLGGIISSFLWAIDHLILTGDPVYPFLTKLLGSSPLDPAHLKNMINYEPGWGAGWSGYKNFFLVALGVTLGDYGRTLGPLVIFAVLKPLGCLAKDHKLRMLAFLSLSGWVLLSSVSLILRYHLVFVALLSVVTAISLSSAVAQRYLKIIAVLFFSLLLCNKINWREWRNKVYPAGMVAFLGVDSKTISFDSPYQQDVEVLQRLYHWIDLNTPRDKKWLVLGETRIYKFPRLAIFRTDQDEEWLYKLFLQGLSNAEILKKMQDENIYGCFINTKVWNHYISLKTDSEREEIETFLNQNLTGLLIPPGQPYIIAKMVYEN